MATALPRGFLYAGDALDLYAKRRHLDRETAQAELSQDLYARKITAILFDLETALSIEIKYNFWLGDTAGSAFEDRRIRLPASPELIDELYAMDTGHSLFMIDHMLNGYVLINELELSRLIDEYGQTDDVVSVEAESQ